MDLLDYGIGSRLVLDVYDGIGQLIDREFTSQFEEAINEYEAYIAVPIVEGVVYPLRVGWKIAVYLQDGNNFHRFFAQITERKNTNGIAIMRIDRISAIDTAQRRMYYRFRCTIPFRYRFIHDPIKDMGLPFVDSETIDLSGAGLSFRSSDLVKEEQIIECELFIDEEVISVTGKVARCVPLDHNPDFRYEVGILFSEIEQKKRESIFRFIFNEERRRIGERFH